MSISSGFTPAPKMMLYRMYRGWMRYWRIPTGHKRVLIEAAVLVSIVRGALYAFPFRTVLRTIEAKAESRVRGRQPGEREVRRVLWAVTAVSRRLVPDRPCLTQALAARFMLARRGCDAELIIGVAKERDEPLTAHAWLEKEGTVILGGADSPTRYRAFPSIPLSGQ